MATVEVELTPGRLVTLGVNTPVVDLGVTTPSVNLDVDVVVAPANVQQVSLAGGYLDLSWFGGSGFAFIVADPSGASYAGYTPVAGDKVCVTFRPADLAGLIAGESDPDLEGIYTVSDPTTDEWVRDADQPPVGSYAVLTDDATVQNVAGGYSWGLGLVLFKQPSGAWELGMIGYLRGLVSRLAINVTHNTADEKFLGYDSGNVWCDPAAASPDPLGDIRLPQVADRPGMAIKFIKKTAGTVTIKANTLDTAAIIYNGAGSSAASSITVTDRLELTSDGTYWWVT